VRSSRAGRETQYALDASALGDVSDWVELVGAEWEARLGRLQRALTGPDRDA
jgi:hypothetical protein